uniref:Uncharacterized protein n=1 Tax=viral metagenome TaxID=1070528 RepID=A0A6H2A3P3_9ZZZZ
MSRRPTAQDIREFCMYLETCTDAQVRGVLERESKAGRVTYVRLAYPIRDLNHEPIG